MTAGHDPGDGADGLLGGLNRTMIVVTTDIGRTRAGCLVGFHCQASIAPVRHAVFLSRQNRTHHVADGAAFLAVHFLSAEQVRLAELFGGRTGDDIDKFDRCAWRPGPRGQPILVDADAWIVGEVVGRWPTGDHEGFLLAPVAAGGSMPAEPLRFANVQDMEPGHAP